MSELTTERVKEIRANAEILQNCGEAHEILYVEQLQLCDALLAERGFRARADVAALDIILNGSIRAEMEKLKT
jgi:hypothetical protein